MNTPRYSVFKNYLVIVAGELAIGLARGRQVCACSSEIYGRPTLKSCPIPRGNWFKFTSYMPAEIMMLKLNMDMIQMSKADPC